MPGASTSRSGPPPDPNALRRERPGDQSGWRTLPDRRDGPAPAWPIPTATSRERAMWTRLWTTPQSVEWERLGMADEVAIYVRTFCAAAEPDARADLRTLVIRQQEGLGLSMPGLARNRWRIGSQEPAREAVKSDGRRAPSVKDRFQVIAGDAAAS